MLWVMEINKLIRERRLQLRLTQAELAERYHVSRTTICKHIKIAREVVDSGRV